MSGAVLEPMSHPFIFMQFFDFHSILWGSFPECRLCCAADNFYFCDFIGIS
jgi:hypothetical protein